MTKINLGCGWRNFGSDWVHIDGGDYEHLDHDDIFDFPYENVDLIYASHVIEYFNREEIVPILQNWRSKLKPGGILRLAVPNFATLCAIYMRGNPVEKVLGPLYGQMPMGDDTIYHRTTYDEPSLRTMLVLVGLPEFDIGIGAVSIMVNMMTIPKHTFLTWIRRMEHISVSIWKE